MSVKLKNKDYIWSYLGIIFSIGSQVVLLPFAIFFLSSDLYGLWSVFQSLAAITALFDFGFSTTFARNINYCWSGAKKLKKQGVEISDSGEPNFSLMKQTMEACRYIFLVLSVMALIIMAICGTIYIRHICGEIFSTEILAAWGCYLLAIFLNIYYGYYQTFLRGVGAITDVNRVMVITRLLQIVLSIGLLMAGFGIIGMGAGYLAYGVVFRIMSRYSFMRFCGIGKHLKQIKDKTTKRQVKEIFGIIWHNASREGIITLSNYLANQACTIICSLFMSLSMTGVYALAVQIATAVAQVSGALYTANQPVLQSAWVAGDRQQMRKTMSLIVLSYSIMFVVCMAAAAVVGLPILRLIKPGVGLTVPVVLGVGAYFFLLYFRNCYTSYFSCTNRIPYMKAFLFSSAVCVVLALILLDNFGWGIWGLILAQLISQCIYNVWYWPLKAHQEMELKMKETVILGVEEIRKIFRKGKKHE